VHFRSIVSIGGRRGLLNEDRNEHVLLRHATRPASLLINRLCIEASTDNPIAGAVTLAQPYSDRSSTKLQSDRFLQPKSPGTFAGG
jgi:hypothetical protein